MINSVNFNHLPIQDLVVSGLIIFIMSTIIANIYDPLKGVVLLEGAIKRISKTIPVMAIGKTQIPINL